MSISAHRVYQCTQSNCRFRFPVMEREIDSCPRCHAALQLCHIQYRRSEMAEIAASPQQPQGQTPQIDILLDNVRSAYNVGSIFRTANAVGVQHLHLCGMTAIPTNSKVGKTALGAEKMVPWTYHTNSIDRAIELKEAGYTVWALEKCVDSTSLFDIKHHQIRSPTALIIGNEISGVDPKLVEISDQVLHIPMQGDKRSLNVTVAFGIAIYSLKIRADDINTLSQFT